MGKKKSHGGKRPGAGRPQASPDGPAVILAVSVPSGLVAELDARAEKEGWGRSEAVTRAIRSLLGKRQPAAKK